jgi:hypothetical protein
MGKVTNTVTRVYSQTCLERALKGKHVSSLYRQVPFIKKFAILSGFFSHINTNVLYMYCISGNINKEHEYVQSLFVVSLN